MIVSLILVFAMYKVHFIFRKFMVSAHFTIQSSQLMKIIALSHMYKANFIT